jgi:hypothetical protein
MTPRQFSTSVAQQISKSLAITELALGLSASVFAPSAALAAPSQGSLPDLVVGPLYFKSIDVAETATIPVVVRNNGSKAAITTELYVNIGPGLGLLAVQPRAGDDWRCTQPLRSNVDGSTTINCVSTTILQPDASKMLGLKVHGEPNQSADKRWLALSVDPRNGLTESNEDNNVSISHF